MVLSNPPLDCQHTKGRFTDKVSIITGGASGIGRATVYRFVNDGAAVAVFDINESAGKQLQTDLATAGYNVKFYQVDVSVKEQCVEAVKKVGEEHEGKIDILVNNAAIGAPCKGLDSTRQDWDRVLGVNVIGYSNMVQACYPFMKGTRNCSVVNISSVQAHRANPEPHAGWTYQASKAAVTTMTKCMALDLSADGIRVNSVSPGYTWTEQVEGILGDRKICESETAAKRCMCRRFCEPAEIAAAVAFLSSKDASYITGTELAVDGGFLALGPEGLEDE